jgi:soluble lytic murein transglycosylase
VAEAARDANLPAVLVCSVIRQESLWDKEAVSRSGARGLMQLMPPTARHVARANGLPNPTLARLHDPSWNTKAGAAYLERMLKRYNGRLFLALAAYNAGPSRVDAWLKRTNCPDRPDMFIESIPLRETRSYVRRILLNIWEYGRLYPRLQNLNSVAAPDRVYYRP